MYPLLIKQAQKESRKDARANREPTVVEETKEEQICVAEKEEEDHGEYVVSMDIQEGAACPVPGARFPDLSYNKKLNEKTLSYEAPGLEGCA